VVLVAPRHGHATTDVLDLTPISLEVALRDAAARLRA